MVSNCTFGCCQGDLCNEPNTIPTMAPPLQCYECTDTPGFTGVPKCDSDNVTTITCDWLSDRCLTMKYKYSFGEQSLQDVVFKNCSNSISCDPQYEYNYCKVFASSGWVSDCTLDCCQGNLCNNQSTIPGSTIKPNSIPSSTMKPSLRTEPINSSLRLAASFGAIWSALVLIVFAGIN
ncbi:hypothetical protein ACROYT_G034358 [Oculina patagonica]